MNHIAHPQIMKVSIVVVFFILPAIYAFYCQYYFKWRVNYYIRSICPLIQMLFILETNIRFNQAKSFTIFVYNGDTYNVGFRI
jgi:hypothetical protein